MKKMLLLAALVGAGLWITTATANDVTKAVKAVGAEGDRVGERVAKEYGRTVDNTGKLLHRHRNKIMDFVDHATRERK